MGKRKGRVKIFNNFKTIPKIFKWYWKIRLMISKLTEKGPDKKSNNSDKTVFKN